MDYRLYKPQDFDGLFAIEEACFEPPQRFSRSYMRSLIRHPNTATWIASLDGRMCGFGIVEWGQESAGIVGYIQTLEVLTHARGAGVGGELLRLLEGSIREAGATCVWLHVDARNAAAIRLYKRHRYELQDRVDDYYGPGNAALIYARDTHPIGLTVSGEQRA